MATNVELKQVNEKLKALREEQKALKAKNEEGKEERKALAKTKSEARKNVKGSKTELRNLLGEINEVMKSNDSTTINNLANALMEASTELAAHVRKFGSTLESLDEL